VGRIKDPKIRAHVEGFQNWIFKDVLPTLRKLSDHGVDGMKELKQKLAHAELRDKLSQSTIGSLREQHANEIELYSQAYDLLHNGFVYVPGPRGGHKITKSYDLRVYQDQEIRRLSLSQAG
jgi:hypothetical protein